MSILDHHLTDIEMTQYCQDILDEVSEKFDISDNSKVKVTSFFLNPEDLGCTEQPDSISTGILRKLGEILPATLFTQLPPGAAEALRGLGDVTYYDDGTMNVVFCRPNSNFTLAQRIASQTGIKTEEIALNPNETVYGYDNLDLLSFIHEKYNSMANGGTDLLEKQKRYHLIQFRSMHGAKRQFINRDGNVKIIGLHEATAHIAAFTMGRIPYNYLGFANDLGLVEETTDLAYGNIMNRLVALKHTTQKRSKDYLTYSPLPVAQLIPAMHELLDEYENKITPTAGKEFKALYRYYSIGEINSEEQEILNSASYDGLMQATVRLIVFRTVKALKTVMGEHILKYLPEKKDGSYARMDRLLSLRNN